MNRFTPNTKSEMVVKELRHAIQTCGMKSGTMLESVRTLAEKYAVSTTIVQRALDMLESENLIWREHGRGVFVKDFRKDRTIEFAVLGFSPQDENSYAQRVAGILSYPNCREGYNFTIRSFTRKGRPNPDLFLQEFRKIANFQNPDCILIHDVHLTNEHIKEMLKIPIPAIFIGQFSHEDSDDLNFSQIRHQSESAVNSAISSMLSEHPFREFIFLTGSCNHSFNREGFEGAQKAARKYNAKMNVIELPKHFGGHSKEEQNDLLKPVRKALNTMKGIPVYCSGTTSIVKTHLQKEFQAHDFYAGKTNPDSNRFFYDAIYSEINLLVKNPSTHHKVILDDICTYEKIIGDLD